MIKFRQSQPDITDINSQSVRNEADETLASTGASGAESATGFGLPAADGEVGVLGPYRIVKQLGRGGMGAVYAAIDTRLERQLALKVMLPEYAANPSAKERFLREARAAAKISHDNVVTVYEADEREGVPYIAMQYLEGYPLDGYLKKKGNPSLQQVLRIAMEAAAGLAAAHKIGLVHRDIKPGNLWLEAPNGRVKVLDFGLAKPVDAEIELTKSGAIVGTPAYMSPEQARGEKVDARTDLFSLGALLYRLCTGKLPFHGPTTMAVLMALGTEEPAPVRELNPEVPESLAELIHQLLAKKADARPQSAVEVAKRARDIAKELATPRVQPVEQSTSLPQLVASQLVYVPMQVTVLPEANPFADITDSDTEEVSGESDEAPIEAVGPSRKKPRRWAMVAAGFAALAALVLGGVVIIIKNKDGTETKIEVPDGATVTVKGKDGKSLGQFGSEKTKPSAADNSIDRKAAEWVIAQGGFVRVNGEGKERRAIAELPKDRFTLTSADLDNTKTTDAGLEHLKELKGLTHLDLRDTAVSDAGLEHLKELKSLTWLSLTSTKVTDAGLERLKDLKGLTYLDLSITKVTDVGVAHLKELKNLTVLSLNGTAVSDAGLVYIEKLTGLQWLGLSGTAVSDAGLAHLKELTGLTHLYLNSTKVTDAGLVHLKELKGLTYLHLGVTKVSAKGLEELRAALPACKIEHDGGVIEAIDLDRKAAEWLLASKAHFAISNEKGHQEFPSNTTEKLPAGAFQVTSFRLPADKFSGDADLARFRNLAKLDSIVLSQTAITDKGLEHLAALPSLSKLYLVGTKATDAGLTLLAKCQTLDTLHLQKTAVSEAAVKKLATALPKCKIEYDGGVIEPK